MLTKRIKNTKYASIFAGLLAMALVVVGCGEELPPDELRAKNAKADMERFEAANLRLTRELRLEDALAIAQKYNLDTMLMQRQQEIRREMASQAWLKMLPSLQGEWDHNDRSQYSASSSKNLETGDEALTTSYSSDKDSHTHNLTLMWNVLDFGLSYYAARQAENQVVIQHHQIARARQDLAMKVARAYWEALVSQQGALESAEIISMLEERDARLLRRMKDKMIPKKEGLSSRKDVLSILVRLRGFEKRHEKAQESLVRLMGLAPGTKVRLAPLPFPYIKTFDEFDVKALEGEALANRPELFKEDLEEKISEDGVRVAVLKMLPSPSVSLRHDWDSNPYQHANYWYTTSAKSSWDLLSIPQHIASMKAGKKKTEFIQQRRMSMAIGIMAQVHLSVINYHDMASRCVSSAKLNKVQQELLNVTNKMAKQGTTNRANLLAQRIETFFSRIQYMEDYAALQYALAQLDNTVGRTQDLSAHSIPLRKIEKAKEAEVVPLERTYGVDGKFMQGMPKVTRKRADAPAAAKEVAKSEDKAVAAEKAVN
jgi:outer membrane protein TolC